MHVESNAPQALVLRSLRCATDFVNVDADEGGVDEVLIFTLSP